MRISKECAGGCCNPYCHILTIHECCFKERHKMFHVWICDSCGKVIHEQKQAWRLKGIRGVYCTISCAYNEFRNAVEKVPIQLIMEQEDCDCIMCGIENSKCQKPVTKKELKQKLKEAVK